MGGSSGSVNGHAADEYGPATTEALSVARDVQTVQSGNAVEHVLKSLSDGFLHIVGEADVSEDDDTSKALPLLVMAITNVQRTEMPEEEDFVDACNDLLAMITLEELRRAGLAQYTAVPDLYDRRDELSAQFQPKELSAAEGLSARARSLWTTAVKEAGEGSA